MATYDSKGIRGKELQTLATDIAKDINGKQPARLVVSYSDTSAFSKISAAIAAGKDVWLNTNEAYSGATYSHYVPLTEAVFINSGSYAGFIFSRPKAYGNENGVIEKWTCQTSGWAYATEHPAYAETAGTAGAAVTANDYNTAGGSIATALNNISTAVAGKAVGGAMTLDAGYALSITIPWATRTGRSSMLFTVSGNNGAYSVVEVSWFKGASATFSNTPRMHVLACSDTGTAATPALYYQSGSAALGAVGIYLVMGNTGWNWSVSWIAAMESYSALAISSITRDTAITATSAAANTLWNAQSVAGIPGTVQTARDYDTTSGSILAALNSKLTYNDVIDASSSTAWFAFAGCPVVVAWPLGTSYTDVEAIIRNNVSTAYRNTDSSGNFRRLYIIINIGSTTRTITGFINGLSYSLDSCRAMMAVQWGTSFYRMD